MARYLNYVYVTVEVSSLFVPTPSPCSPQPQKIFLEGENDSQGRVKDCICKECERGHGGFIPGQGAIYVWDSMERLFRYLK